MRANLAAITLREWVAELGEGRIHRRRVVIVCTVSLLKKVWAGKCLSWYLVLEELAGWGQNSRCCCCSCCGGGGAELVRCVGKRVIYAVVDQCKDKSVRFLTLHLVRGRVARKGKWRRGAGRAGLIFLFWGGFFFVHFWQKKSDSAVVVFCLHHACFGRVNTRSYRSERNSRRLCIYRTRQTIDRRCACACPRTNWMFTHRGGENIKKEKENASQLF